MVLLLENLGVTTSNHADACALWMDLKLIYKREIRNIDIYGDSQIMVNAINQNLVDFNPQLDRFLFRIWGLLRGLGSFQVFLIRRRLNTMVDMLENLECHLEHHKLGHVRGVKFVASPQPPLIFITCDLGFDDGGRQVGEFVSDRM